MNMILRAALAGAGGAFANEYLEPHLLKLVNPTGEMAIKLTKAASIGASTAGIFWVLGKVS